MQDRIDKLEARFTDHVKECSRQFGRIEEQVKELEEDIQNVIEGQEGNSQKIETILKEVRELCRTAKKTNEETEGMRQLWQDLQGTIRIGSFVRKIIIWLIGLPVIGAGIHNIWIHVIQYFKG